MQLEMRMQLEMSMLILAHSKFGDRSRLLDSPPLLERVYLDHT